MKRKIIALCLVVAMLGVAVISGTMAYFTDTAEAVNVMTIGSVKIELIEEKRVVDANGDVVTGADGKPEMETLDPDTGYQMVPAVYDNEKWADSNASANDKVFHADMKNVYDKFVSVKNTGRSDAYVRLFFAFEDTNNVSDKLHINNTASFNPVLDPEDNKLLHTVIDGVTYEVMSYTYPTPIKAGETSEYSLKQFFFDKTTTNEDVAAAGEEYTILIIAQAVQASGFDDADTALNAGFGVPNAATEDTTDGDTLNVEAWFGNLPVRVNDSTELAAAIEAGETNVTLAKAGNYTLPTMPGKTVTISGTKDTVIDASQAYANGAQNTNLNITFDGVTVTFGTANYLGGFAHADKVVYKNCKLIGKQTLYADTVEFIKCDLDTTAVGAEHTAWTWGAKNISFTDCTFTYGDRAVNCYGEHGDAQTVTFTGCKFITANAASEGAVEINSMYFTQGIDVVMDNCTAPANGPMVYVSRWDNQNGAKTTITIDGVEQ